MMHCAVYVISFARSKEYSGADLYVHLNTSYSSGAMLGSSAQGRLVALPLIWRRFRHNFSNRNGQSEGSRPRRGAPRIIRSNVQHVMSLLLEWMSHDEKQRALRCVVHRKARILFGQCSQEAVLADSRWLT